MFNGCRAPYSVAMAAQIPTRRSTGDSAIDRAIVELLALVPVSDRDGRLDNRDQLRDILVTTMSMALDSAAGKNDRLDLKIANSALAEMRDGYRMFQPHRARRKVTIFGSARTEVTDPLYELTRKVAAALSAKDWMIITGAGPGIMAAGLEGAGRGNALGVSIRLPFESEANEFVEPANLVDMRYFFTRKLALLREASAFVVMPGGFGTLDEAFELLTLIQTGKATPVPIVMLGLGKGYWTAWQQFMDKVAEEGYTSATDRSMYCITNSVEEAVAEIERFYGNFHSLRWQGDTLILRMLRSPQAHQLRDLQSEFGPFTDGSPIEITGPLSSEIAEHDHLELARLSLQFNRRQPGRLRRLIDMVNEW
jgi:uncharacterized protein (TIGR00730 family)